MARPSFEPGARRLTWGLGLGQLMSWGSLYYGFPLFVLPMEADLGWSRMQLTLALSLGLIVAGLAAPFVGNLIDRGHGRAVLTGGSVLGAAMYAVWSWSPNLPTFYAAWAGMGVAHAMTLYEPAFAVLHRELGGHANPSVTRVTLLGGLASTVFIPLTQWLVLSFDWRVAALSLAAVNLILCAPLYAWAVPRTTGPGIQSLIGNAAVSRALRAPAFWALAVAFAMAGMVFSAVAFHLVPLLTERSLTATQVVLVVALIGPLQVAGRFAIYALGPAANVRIIGIAGTSALVAALLLLVHSRGLGLALAFAALYGLSNGVNTIVRGTAAAEFLGCDRFGSINGLLSAPVSFAKAVAPAAAGILWASSEGYTAVLWALSGCAAVGLIAFWLVAARATSGTPEHSPAPRTS